MGEDCPTCDGTAKICACALIGDGSTYQQHHDPDCPHCAGTGSTNKAKLAAAMLTEPEVADWGGNDVDRYAAQFDIYRYNGESDAQLTRRVEERLRSIQ